MPRHQKNQIDAKSCGAATTLCAQAELGMGQPVDDTNEDSIWQTIRMSAQGPVPSELAAFATETLPHAIAGWFRGRGRGAEILESPSTAGGSNPLTKQYPLLGVLYAAYRDQAQKAGATIVSRDPASGDVGSGERLFLVVKIDGMDATHYILVRQEGSQVWIMNPDGATDDQMPVPTVGGTFTTGGGARSYVFTGIAVKVS